MLVWIIAGFGIAVSLLGTTFFFSVQKLKLENHLRCLQHIGNVNRNPLHLKNLKEALQWRMVRKEKSIHRDKLLEFYRIYCMTYDYDDGRRGK